MKSYFLAPVASRDAAILALNAVLPDQNKTWLLKDTAGDVTAYFSLVEADDTTGERTIQADVSGRHYNQDVDVVSVLQSSRHNLEDRLQMPCNSTLDFFTHQRDPAFAFVKNKPARFITTPVFSFLNFPRITPPLFSWR
ncbi:MAG: hypothetical protein WCS42_18450 [Verrucomicrobiota bacterium]